ncbi:hypothetical protein SAMN04487949_2376 [Halogranum gelatinilyticum]|uniref:DUF2795 domain-containing protein n=1 Tax=Halogranum gelatinilyticum TaxID=660521 RepID=A0A1G9VGL1_9EURY|nr:hypothetical protein [Halogranum gelatinilyticum]SDM71382.1 hypothetical protein SAMN04487949_2376 [Halogranum gelatinilyticum]
MNMVKLSRVESLFEDLDFPVTRDEAATEFSDTTVQLADGEANLGEMLSEAQAERFHGADELYAALNNTLPIEAVGEPGQSDGDA